MIRAILTRKSHPCGLCLSQWDCVLITENLVVKSLSDPNPLIKYRIRSIFFKFDASEVEMGVRVEFQIS